MIPDNDPNPAPEVETDEPETEEVETEATETDEAADAEPEEGQAAEDDTDEVELDGQTYRVPKAVKASVLMHKDYTRKTQETAEQRRVLDQQRTALEEGRKSFEEQTKAREANFRDIAKLIHFDEQLDAYNKVDWDRLHSEDPVAYTKRFGDFMMLKSKRQELAQATAAKHQELNQQAQRETAKRYDEFLQAIPREIPDWSPQLNAEITDVALRHGFATEEVKRFSDIRWLKVLRLAAIGEKTVKQQRTISTKPKPTEAKPVSQVGARSSPPTRMSDKMSTDAWIEARNKQARAGR